MWEPKKASREQEDTTWFLWLVPPKKIYLYFHNFLLWTILGEHTWRIKDESTSEGHDPWTLNTTHRHFETIHCKFDKASLLLIRVYNNGHVFVLSDERNGPPLPTENLERKIVLRCCTMLKSCIGNKFSISQTFSIIELLLLLTENYTKMSFE